MSDLTSEVTVDVNEWEYIDRFGIGHKVTNAQTFNLAIQDDSSTVVKYNIPVGQSVTTDDGLTINFRPRTKQGGAQGSLPNEIATMIDAKTSYEGFKNTGNLNGEIDIECPVSGVIQHWKVATIAPSDVDFGSAGTIAATFEDQFGNTMFWKAGMNVGQAA